MALSKKEQILKAAESIFAEKGFEGTSIRDLAKKAKVNVAMVSYYFGSKEKLFIELVEYRGKILHKQLQNINENKSEDPMDKINKLIDLYIDRFLSPDPFHKIIHREISLKQRSTVHLKILQILIQNTNEIKQMVDYGQKKGVFRKSDTELMISTIIGTLNHITLSNKFTSHLLHKKAEGTKKAESQHKIRVKKYLNELVKNYLLLEK